MKGDPILARGARLVRARRYAQAIRLLEPEVVRYHDSFRFYYVLAVACLKSGDAGGALTYFRRAREIKPREPSALVGLAVLHLRRGETERAVSLSLEALEAEPGSRSAKRVLAFVRRCGDPDALSAEIETGRIARLYPEDPKVPFSPARAASAAALAAVAAAGAWAVLVAVGLAASPFPKPASRAGIADSELAPGERSDPVALGGSFRYVLTERQVVAAFEAAQDHFRAYRDEAARVEINRILESNASEAVKSKAKLLASFSAVPGFDTLKDRFSYAEVAADPVLYRGCHVAWRGMAANVRLLDGSTSFDLLVGYDSKNSLQGIVPVAFSFAVDVDPERPLEVLARVEPAEGSKHPVRLAGLAVHQAASR